MSGKRSETLEGMRGLAAIVVVFWHSTLGFLPQLSGIFPNFPQSDALTGQAAFFAINGAGAVAFFFVLSGFVLSRHALKSSSSVPIVKGILKRWPRLALPTTIATIFSWLLFQVHFYQYEKAGAISGSPWLSKFAYSPNPPVHGSIFEALSEGAIFTFLNGDLDYDTSLWTMKFEFFGSFAVFGLTLALLAYKSRSREYALIPLILVILMAGYATDWFSLFIMGVALAWFLPDQLRVRAVFRWLLAIFALYLLGYLQPIGAFAVFAPFSPVYVNSIGAIILVVVTYDVHLRGGVCRFARFLGEISFPLYLLHVPILCSLGSATFVFMHSQGLPHPSLVATVATIIASVIVSLPLIAINSRWIRFLNTKVAAAVPDISERPSILKR